MRIKEIRVENNLTQKEVSNYLCVSRGTYAMWENELDLFPIKRLNAFCKLTNTSFDYVLELTETKNYLNTKNINIELSGKRLKEIRKKNNYTQDRLAKKLDIDQSLISKYEKGISLISTTFLESYAKLFHISCDYLLGKIEEKIILKEKIMN